MASESLSRTRCPKLCGGEGWQSSEVAPGRKDCGWEGFLKGWLSENSPEDKGCPMWKMAVVDGGSVYSSGGRPGASRGQPGRGQGAGLWMDLVLGPPSPALRASRARSQIRGFPGCTPWPPGPSGHWMPSAVAGDPSQSPPIALRGQLAPRCVLALHSSLVRRRISPAGTGGAGTLPVHSRGRDEAPCTPALGTGPGP